MSTNAARLSPDPAPAAEEGSAAGSPGGRLARVTRYTERVGAVASRFALAGQIVCLVAMFGVVCVGIIYRKFLDSSLSYSTELLTFLLTWLVYLGVPRTIWDDSAPRLDLFRSTATARRIFAGLSLGTVATYFVYVTEASIGFLPIQSSFSTELGFSAYWFGLALTVGSVAGLVLVLLRMVPHVADPLAWLGVALGIAIVALSIGFFALTPILALAIMFGLIVIGTPIAVALGLGGLTLLSAAGIPLLAAPQRLTAATSNIVLISIPLFLFVGALIGGSGLAQRFARFAQAAIGWIPGGLGVSNVATSAIFANLTGSAVADTAAIGRIYIPQLVRSKEYTPARAAALQSAAGVVGILFPPAIAMILFATVTNSSVIQVFAAVVVPGLLVCLAIAATSVITVASSGRANTRPFSARTLVRTAWGAIPVLCIPLVLDGGIFTGIVTPAESGAIAILVTLIWMAGFDGPASISPRTLLRSTRAALDGAVLALFILVNVSILDFGFASSGLSDGLISFLDHFTSSPLLFLLVLNVVLLAVHTFLETGPAILVLVPLIIPAAQAAGISMLQLAAVVGVNSTIGLILPPVGVSLYVASGIAEVNPKSVVRYSLPYVAACLASLAIVTTIPAVSEWLPGLFGR